jgi:hypothetical protein
MPEINRPLNLTKVASGPQAGFAMGRKKPIEFDIAVSWPSGAHHRPSEGKNPKTCVYYQIFHYKLI